MGDAGHRYFFGSWPEMPWKKKRDIRPGGELIWRYDAFGGILLNKDTGLEFRTDVAFRVLESHFEGDMRVVDKIKLAEISLLPPDYNNSKGE